MQLRSCMQTPLSVCSHYCHGCNAHMCTVPLDGVLQQGSLVREWIREMLEKVRIFAVFTKPYIQLKFDWIKI